MNIRKWFLVTGVLALIIVSSGVIYAHGDHEAASASSAEAEEGSLAITVNGWLVDGQAYRSSDLSELYVPLRSVAEGLGASVKWDDDHQAVLIDTTYFPDMMGHSHDSSAHGGAPMLIYKGQMLMPSLDPFILNGTLMVSADTIQDAFGVSVKFNAVMNQVMITTPDSLQQFNDEEQQVQDALNGVGMKPQMAADGAKEFTLTAEMHPWSPLKGVLTTAWTYNGQVSGPVIRVTEGDHVRVTLVNKLPEPTTIHWHGMHVPNDMDGVPGITQDAVNPGKSFTYDFIAGHPGTYMYHSHYDDMKQIGSGLYGAFIIDPKNPDSEPHYDHNYMMMIGGFQVNATDEEKDYWTLNGRSYPDTPPIEVKKGETVRIRLANIDTTEVHTMHLHGMDFQVVAKDGHPVAQPQTMNTVLIGPGETYDIAFTADNVGEWMFHCHILDHTMNGGEMASMAHGEMGGLITLVKVTE